MQDGRCAAGWGGGSLAPQILDSAPLKGIVRRAA